MEQRKHWWNGSWGRLARRDVFLRADADRWFVEARVGGAEGRSRFTEYDTEESAYDAVRRLFDGPGAWREVSAAGPAPTGDTMPTADGPQPPDGRFVRRRHGEIGRP